MKHGGDQEHNNKQHDEDDVWRSPTLKHEVDGRTDEHDHHDDGVEGTEYGGDDELERGLGEEADADEDGRRDESETVRPIQAHSKHGVVCSRCHEQYSCRTEHRGGEHGKLVQQVQPTDVVVHLVD